MKHDNRTLLTEGPIAGNLVRFALPFLGSSLIQQLYSTVDQIFTGQVLGRDASAAVGASGIIVTCLLGFFTIEGDELRVDSVKAQLIRCDLRAPDAITGMTSDQLEFDKPVGEQDLPSRLAPEIGDYCFSEAEAHRLVDDLLEQVFPEYF